MNVHQVVYEFEGEIRSVGSVVDFLQSGTLILEVSLSALHVQLFPDNGTYPIGFTATAYFQESYIALDTWPEHSYVHLNVVCCKVFSEDKIEMLIRRSFPSTNGKPLVIKRLPIKKGYSRWQLNSWN